MSPFLQNNKQILFKPNKTIITLSPPLNQCHMTTYFSLNNSVKSRKTFHSIWFIKFFFFNYNLLPFFLLQNEKCQNILSQTNDVTTHWTTTEKLIWCNHFWHSHVAQQQHLLINKIHQIKPLTWLNWIYVRLWRIIIGIQQSIVIVTNLKRFRSKGLDNRIRYNLTIIFN